MTFWTWAVSIYIIGFFTMIVLSSAIAGANGDNPSMKIFLRALVWPIVVPIIALWALFYFMTYILS